MSAVCVPTRSCCFLKLLSKCETQVRIVVLCFPSGQKASKKFLDPVRHETVAVKQKMFWYLRIVNLDIVNICLCWSRVNISHWLTAGWDINWDCVLLPVKMIHHRNRSAGVKQEMLMLREWPHRFSCICLNLFWFWDTIKIHLDF